MRGQVAAELEKFRQHVKNYGPDVVREVLKKGKCKAGRITCSMNRKDRFEMLQVLGLTVKEVITE
jgi:hypothetical protein